MSFHDLLAHFFWLMYHCLFIHLPPEGHLGYFQILAIASEIAIHIHVMNGFCVDISFQLL